MKEQIYNLLNNKRMLMLILIYVVMGIALITIILFLVLSNFSRSNLPGQNPNNIPTINPNYTPPPTYPPVVPSDSVVHKQLTVVSSTPANNQNNIPVNLDSIVITFDQPVVVSDVPLAIAPSIQYSISSQGNNLIIKPLQNLEAGVIYSIVLRLYKNNHQLYPYILNFGVVGPTLTPIPTDSFNVQQEYNTQRQAAPDVFLSNYTPHTASDFYISSSYNSQLDHFQFVVTLSGDQTQAKQDFISWLKSMQFTDQQIQSLDITYQ